MNQKKFFIIFAIVIFSLFPPTAILIGYTFYWLSSIELSSESGKFVLLMFLITSSLFFGFRYLLIKSLRIKFSQEENVDALSLKDLKNKQKIEKEDSVIMLYLFYCFFKFVFILYGTLFIFVLL